MLTHCLKPVWRKWSAKLCLHSR